MTAVARPEVGIGLFVGSRLAGMRAVAGRGETSADGTGNRQRQSVNNRPGSLLAKMAMVNNSKSDLHAVFERLSDVVDLGAQSKSQAIERPSKWPVELVVDLHASLVFFWPRRA